MIWIAALLGFYGGACLDTTSFAKDVLTREQYRSSIEYWCEKVASLKADQRGRRLKYRGKKKPLTRTVSEMERECREGKKLLALLARGKDTEKVQHDLDEVLRAFKESFANVTTGVVMQ